MRSVIILSGVLIVLVPLCVSPALAEGNVSGEFPDRTFSVTRSTPGGPQSDTFAVEMLPQTTGDWWVIADTLAGSSLTVTVFRNDAGTPIIESSSKLRFTGEVSPKILLTAGVAYTVTFQSYGKAGTSVLHEQFSWVRQFGAAGHDGVYDIATDGSSVYAAGWEGMGSPLFHTVLWKLDSGGSEVWTRHIEAAGLGFGVAVDGTGVYVAGFGSALPGQASGGIFLRKYDFDGNELWTRQFSTGGSDGVGGVAVDGTGAYLTGWTDGAFSGSTNAGEFDVYLRKYDPDGNELWTRQFGSSASESATAIDADPSGVYITGRTTVVPVPFIARYDSNGNEVWTRQFGTTGEALAIDVEGAGVYVAGRADVYAWTDAFVRKYDLDGNEVWGRQFGSDYNYDEAFAIDVDGAGVYVAGWTDGVLPGQLSAGSADAFVRKYDLDGNESWTRQIGTSGYDVAHDIEASGVYVAGRAGGAFPGQSNAGGVDAFLARLPH
jgi:hypothetical protein